MSIKFDKAHSDPGMTELDTAIATAMVDLLKGLDRKQTLSALLNAAGIAICEFSKTETAAHDEARNFRRNLDRAIAINWPIVQKEREKGK